MKNIIIKTAVLVMWVAFLYYLLFSGSFVRFLKPSFDFLLFTGATGMLFMLNAQLKDKNSEREEGLLLRSIIIILPLLMIVLSTGAKLDGETFRKRDISKMPGTQTGELPNKAEVKPKTVKSIRAQASAPKIEKNEVPEIKPTDAVQNAAVEVSIVNLYKDTQRLAGKRLIVTGMTMKHKKVSEVFGGNAGLVYRFVINCCAADAMPASVLVVLDRPFEYEKDTWVKATGDFSVEEKEGVKVLLFRNAVLENTEKPKQEYIW
jgi:putative membrane protein